MTTRMKGRWSETLFALFHMALLLAIAGYAVVSLAQGNSWRFLVIMAGLSIYYFIVLDKPVRLEIERRRRLRRDARSGRS